MKNEQKEEAKNLYFQTDMSKTEIANKLGVNRKTVLFWSNEGNWDKLRKSARHLPSLVAEKCYYLIDQYASHLLTEGAIISNYSLKDAQFIHLLASTIKKIKNRSTVNESMELFTFFLNDLNKRDPAMAAQIAPQIEEYITFRGSVETKDLLLEEFKKDGSLPWPHDKIKEQQADQKEYEELVKDFELFQQTRQQNNTTPTSDNDVAVPNDPQNQNEPQPDNNQTELYEAA